MFPETREELIREIEGKFQLALVMSLFFPSFLEAFSSAAGKSVEEASRLFVQSGGFVTFYLFAWICFQFVKGNKKVADFGLKILNWILIVSISAFVTPLLIVTASLAQNQPTSSSWQPAFWLFLYQASLWGIILGGLVASMVAVSYILQIIFKPEAK